MIEQLFQLVLKLSFEATIAGVLILGIKLVFGKKLTKRFNYLIWGFVFIKFVLIISLPSMFSLFNYTDISSNIAIPFISTTPEASIGYSDDFADSENLLNLVPKNFNKTDLNDDEYNITNNIINWYMIVSYLWLFITLFLLLCLLWNYLNLKINIYKKHNPEITENHNELFYKYFHDIGISVNIEIVSSSYARTPFVFGFFKPLIVIPENLLNSISEEEFKSIIYHEATHIKLNHHKIRLLTNIITIIHWFNPFAWAFLKFMQNDAEFYCDNTVLSNYTEIDENNYLNALLKIAKLRHNNPISVLNFGQSNLKRRVVNIMNRKSIPNYAMFISLFLTLILSVTLLTSAMSNNEADAENSYLDELASKIPDNTEFFDRENYNYLNSDSTIFSSENSVTVYDTESQDVAVERSSFNKFDAKDINKLDIDVNVVAVKFQEQKDNNIGVSFSVVEKYNDLYTVSSEIDTENILKIHIDYKTNVKNNIGLKDTKATLIISLPQKTYDEFAVSLNASSINIENPLNIKGMSVGLNASTANICNVTINDFNAISNAGTITLKDNIIKNTFYINNNAGNLNVYTDEINCDLIVENNSANANIYFSEKLYDYNLTIGSNFGSIILPASLQYKETSEDSFGFNKTYSYTSKNGKNAIKIENNTGNVKIEVNN